MRMLLPSGQEPRTSPLAYNVIAIAAIRSLVFISLAPIPAVTSGIAPIAGIAPAVLPSPMIGNLRPEGCCLPLRQWARPSAVHRAICRRGT